MSEYRVTFGQRYAREEHPRWASAHPDGWLTILAPTKSRAREVAVAFLGAYWADLYLASDHDDWSIYPLGELHRIDDRAEHLAWCKKRALAYVDQGDLHNALASLTSDLGKHEWTVDHDAIMLGMMLAMGGHLDTAPKMREWIEGCS